MLAAAAVVAEVAAPDILYAISRPPARGPVDAPVRELELDGGRVDGVDPAQLEPGLPPVVASTDEVLVK